MWSVRVLNDESAICAYNTVSDKTCFVDRVSLARLVEGTEHSLNDMFKLCSRASDNNHILDTLGFFELLEKQ